VSVPLPHSEACERNKGPILTVLREWFGDASHVLEIGSGTGQHAVHFAGELSHLVWRPTDRAEYLHGLRARAAAEAPCNLLEPLELDVVARPWPETGADALYTANTLHIMGWREVEALFAALAEDLPNVRWLAIYGPFNYRGRYTSDTNAAFDAQLRARDPRSGLRDFEAVDALAAAAGFQLERDHSMPANNRLLTYRRPTAGQ
jgi:hypothetical protein